MRINVANELSTTGNEWYQTFKKNNTGTYNSQWMVINYNKFKNSINKPNLDPNILTIIETVPGKMAIRDVSDVLDKYSYYGSYNRPFILTQESGFKDAILLSGDNDNLHVQSSTNNPRANLIKYKQSKINDIESLKEAISYNNNYNRFLGSSEVK